MDIESKKWFYILIMVILITDSAIILNISFLRQIIGFLFLTIFPGLLILQILKLNKVGFTEKLVLSVGLSISFTMFFGLLINNLSLSLGYETPLATISLLISFNLAFILLAIGVYKLNKDSVFSLPNIDLNTSEKAFLIVPVFFPALSILGMYVMNTTDNNLILMFLLFLIPIYVIFVCLFNHKFSKRIYPVVIFSISISLLLLLSLRSNHLIGLDVHSEYYFFRTTLYNLHWSVFGHSALNACLAISLLPSIYQSILNIPSEFLCKILYSLLYSISPLVIYIISKKYVEEGYAFLASCFYIFQWNFLFTEYNARANIAMLFFAFAMMVLFSDKIDPLKKRILFIVFMASCMVSHYSTTYIFFFIMAGTFMGIEILSKKYTFKKVISLTMVILFFSMIFFWYSQVTETAFRDGIRFIENTLISLQEFFVVESRGGGEALLGKGIVEKGIPHKIQFVSTWLTFAFIGIGVITLINRYKEMSFPEQNFKKPDFLKDKFEVGHFVITLMCGGLLVAVIGLPYITVGYGIDRMYPLAITTLSTFFVIGGVIISKQIFKKSLIENFSFKKKTLLNKQKQEGGGTIGDEKESASQQTQNALQVRAYLIILIVLIPYFFCVTGVMYNIFGVPRSIILNSDGEQYDALYVHDQESYGAVWLANNAEQKNIGIYTDRVGDKRLISQAGFGCYIDRWALTDDRDVKIRKYIYLRYYNVVNGKLLDWQNEGHNITGYSDKFTGKGKLYNNGGTEIWK